MADITSDVFVITCGVIIVIVVLAVTFLRLRSAERRMHESGYKLRAYTDLLNAVTEFVDHEGAVRTGTGTTEAQEMARFASAQFGGNGETGRIGKF